MAYQWGGPKSTQPLDVKTLAEIAKEEIRKVQEKDAEDEAEEAAEE